MMNIFKLNFKNLVTVLFIYFITFSNAFATKLPDEVVGVIKKDFPAAVVRFDGLVSLPDGTMYIPVLPSNPIKNAEGKIVSTYPVGKNFSQKPDVVLFDTNFAFLKVVNNKDGKPSITESKNIPFVVKTGLLPQDMLVPPGFVFPDDIQIMLGDLNIALSESRAKVEYKEAPVKFQKSSTNKTFVPVPYMVGKTLLITSLDSKLLNIMPANSTIPKFTLQMENLPKFVQPVCNDNYILVAVAGKTYIDVADVNQEILARKIDLSYMPSELILNSDKTLAYVSVEDDQSIFVIDLKTMTLKEKIKIKGYPKAITMNPENTEIAYIDKNTGDIYTLSLDSSYTNKFVYNSSNISKIINRGDNLYLLSRSNSELIVVDKLIQDVIYQQPVGKKPVDVLLDNDTLYILCASNELNIFNLSDYTMTTVVKLSDSGFSKRLVPVNDSHIILITNVSDKKYVVFDKNKNEVLQTIMTPIKINDLKIMNKELK